MGDQVFSITQRLIAQVVDEKDQYLRDVIVEYAREESKRLGEKIEVLFINKSVVDEIINLGTKEYLRRKQSL